MTSIIKSWTGRTGNNIIQMINCIHYSFYLHGYEKICFRKHHLLNNNEIMSKEPVTKNKKRFTDKDNFFYAKKLGFHLSPCQMREIAQKYIVPILKINLDNSDGSDEISIHLRGGDIMISHPKFIQPPMSYYKKILQENIYSKINIIHEDNLNPCLYKLKELKNSFSQSKSVNEDIEKLCRARRLIMSFSTFSLMIFFISKNIEEIFLPKYMEDEWYPNLEWGLKKNIIFLEDYNMGLWSGKNINDKKNLLLKS